MKPSFEVMALATMTAIMGVVLVTNTAPVPKPTEDCKLYKVDERVVTSFVLKPPPAPEPVCPVVQAPKCEPQALPEIPVEEKKVDEPPKRKRYRHHRIRRYWR